MTGIHSPGSSIARRTLLKVGAGGLGLAALADLAACGNRRRRLVVEDAQDAVLR